MTAFNPPSFLFFNGVTFNPDIIEQGDTVVSGGGDVTLAGNNNFTGANSFTAGSINVTTQSPGNNTTLAASTAFVAAGLASVSGVSLSGNNTFTGANEFTNVAGIVTPAINGAAGVGSFIDVGNTMNFITIGNPTCDTTIKNQTNLETVDVTVQLNANTIESVLFDAIDIGPANATQISLGSTVNAIPVLVGGTLYVDSIDTNSFIDMNIGQNNANQILLGSAGNAIPVTISGTTNIYIDELVVDQDAGKKYVSVDKCYFTTGTSGEATVDTKTAIPLHIAPSIAVEPNAICTEVVIGNSTIPVTVNSTTTTFTGANSFTGGSINVTTQSPGNNTTLAASTAFVTAGIAALSSIYQTAGQVTTSINSSFASFIATSNTFTATQLFPTIRFTAGSMNQAFYIQTASIAFGSVTAGAIVNSVLSYATLGMSNFPSTLINATISNSSTSANGARVIFSISAQSTSSFTVTAMNPTATNAAASAFTIVCYGR